MLTTVASTVSYVANDQQSFSEKLIWILSEHIALSILYCMAHELWDNNTMFKNTDCLSYWPDLWLLGLS